MARSPLFRPALAAMVSISALAQVEAQYVFQEHRGTARFNNTGRGVGFLGDLTGDGYEEYAIGSPGESANRQYSGRVDIYSGLTGQLFRTHDPSGVDDNYGISMIGVGDVDGDGVRDYAIGTPYADGPLGLWQGFAEVLSGKTGSRIWFQRGSWDNALFAQSMASIGDLNGDGVGEVLIGEPGVTSKATVFDGRTGNPVYTNYGQAVDSNFGQSVCGLGDINGDGFPDYGIGEPGYDGFKATDAGAVYVYSGRDGATSLFFHAGAKGSQFGSSIARAGDTNGDSVSEAVIGAPFDALVGVDAGAVFLFDVKNGAQRFRVNGDQSNDRLGTTVVGFPADGLYYEGELNGDTVSDFAAGAPYAAVPYVRTYSGNAGTKFHTYTGPSGAKNYGAALASGKYIGGSPYAQDTHGDLLIGDPFFNDGATTNAGLAHVIHGAPAYFIEDQPGWPGTRGAPRITAKNDPVVGQSITIAISNSRGVTTPGRLLIGFYSAYIPTNKDGVIYLYPTYSIPISIPAGGLTMTDVLPNDPSLYNLSIFLQALEIDPGASKGMSFTNLLGLHLGFDYP